MIFPAIARWYLNRYKNKFYRDNPWAARAEEKKSSRSQSFEQQNQKNKIDTDQLGEYVDYEEIKDKDDETAM